MQELTWAVRRFRKAPAFVLISVLTLAVGIGVNVTLFSLADAVMFRPFAWAEADRLVVAGESQTATRSELSYLNFVDWQRRSQSFAALAAMGSSNWTFTFGSAETVIIPYRAVSGEFFDVLGVRAARGRTLTPTDDRTGAAHVVVISHGLWQRRFGGAADIVGRFIVLSNTPFTVVGVMPANFSYPLGADAWVPLVPALASVQGAGLPDFLTNRTAAALLSVGRLKSGVDVGAARADLDRVIGQLRTAYGGPPRIRARVTPLVDDLLGNARVGLWSLLAAVNLLFVVATANVAGLMLIQTSLRRRELTLRLALGASRIAVARQLLVESIVLALTGTIAALALARLTLPIVVRLVPATIPRLAEASVDGRVVAFTIGIALIATVLCALGPSATLWGRSLDAELRAGSRAVGAHASGRRLRRILVAGEIAIAVVLLAVAGLLYASVRRVTTVDLGFTPDNLLAVTMDEPRALGSASLAARVQFWEHIVDALHALPFVGDAAATITQPLGGPIGLDSSWEPEGQASADAQNNAYVNTETITPGYFATMGARLVAGRAFDRRDGADGQAVVIVNERLARRAWPGQSPLGKRLRVGALNGARTPPPWWTVVGVVGDVRYRDMTTPTLDVYVPLAQSPFMPGALVLRMRGPMTTANVTEIRDRLRGLNPENAVDVVSMREAVAAHQKPWQSNFIFFAAFAALTVFLAVVGLFTMATSIVTEQLRDIGVRIALGATAAGIVRGVLADAGRIATIGAIVGVSLAIGALRVIQGLLFEAAPLDRLMLLAAPLALCAMAIAACLIPALRAARVDPVVTLRAD